MTVKKFFGLSGCLVEGLVFNLLWWMELGKVLCSRLPFLGRKRCKYKCIACSRIVKDCYISDGYYGSPQCEHFFLLLKVPICKLLLKH